MRVLMVDENEIDLNDQAVPFLPNNTVVALNASGAAVTLQSSDTSGSGFTTLQAVADGEAVEVTLDEQYIQLSAAGSLILLGN